MTFICQEHFHFYKSIKTKAMKTVSKVEAMGRILSSKDGRFFSVRFVKKDGSVRDMTCKKVVKSAINGVGSRYNAIERGYIPVYDINNKGYRTVNFDTLIGFKMNGQSYVVNN
jgi:hypothetical protein